MSAHGCTQVTGVLMCALGRTAFLCAFNKRAAAGHAATVLSLSRHCDHYGAAAAGVECRVRYA